MSSFNSGMNPSVVQTELDGVFKQEFDGSAHPAYASVVDSGVFKQDTVTNQAVIGEVFKGSGLWATRAEEQNVAQATPRIGNQFTYRVAEKAQKISIPKTFFDDNMHGSYEKMVRDMAETGRITRETEGFGIYRNAFTTTLTADGAALVSDSHTTLGGQTVANKLTAALTTTSLDSAIKQLVEQKAQDGTIRGQMPEVLLVPLALYQTAAEITGSDLKSGTDFNDMNVIRTKYGIRVATSPYLGAAAGGSDTAWFLLGRNHSVTRWSRSGFETTLVDWKFSDNNSYVYKGSFRETYGAPDYAGLVGSDGTS